MANPGTLGMTTGGLGGLTNEMITNLVMAAFNESAEYHRKFHEKTKGWYNLSRCIFTGERPPFKNVVMLPLLMAACWSDVANKIAISLSGSRIIEMDAIAPEMGQSAKRAEALAAYAQALGQDPPLPSTVITDDSGQILSAHPGLPSISEVRKMLPP